MPRQLRNLILGIVMVTLIVPSALLSYPKKTDAALDCIAGAIAGLLGSTVSDILSVPTSNKSVKADTSQLSFKECVIKPLIRMMVKTLLREFTRSVVEWINSGFQGSPAFMTNPEGFFREVGDQVAGQMIESIAPTLCGPFSLQLRLTLGYHYSSSYSVGCRLSDVQKNVYNAFTGGNFNAGGNGWNNWFALTSAPGNNIFGAYFEATNVINRKVTERINNNIKELDWGKGFKSFRDCVRYEQVLTGYNEETMEETFEDTCAEYGPIKTPGAIIEGQLNETLAAEAREIELAESIDALVGALVNQMINQVFGAVGLGGTSQPSYGGGPSYLDQYSTGAFYTDFQNNTARASGVYMPLGIATSTCTTFNTTATYSTVDALVNGVNQKLVKVTTTNGNNVTTVNAVKADNVTLWSEQDLTKVTAYCAREGINNATNLTLSTIPNYTDQYGSPQIQSQPRNLSYQQPATQSSTYRAEYSADKAVDGITSSSSYQLPAYSSYETNPWWQVELENVSRIDNVKIFKHSNEGYAAILGTFKIIIYDNAQNVVWASADIVTGEDTAIPLIIPVNKVGKFVRIQRQDGAHYLGLAEVQVIGSENTTAATTPDGQPAPVAQIPFNINFTAPTTITVRPNVMNNSYSFGFTANGAKNNLEITHKFERVNGGIASGVPLSQIFTAFTMTLTDTGPNATQEPKTVNLMTLGNPGTFDDNFSFVRDGSYNITHTMTTRPIPIQIGTYRLTTQIKDPEIGTVWTYVSNISASYY